MAARRGYEMVEDDDSGSDSSGSDSGSDLDTSSSDDGESGRTGFRAKAAVAGAALAGASRLLFAREGTRS